MPWSNYINTVQQNQSKNRAQWRGLISKNMLLKYTVDQAAHKSKYIAQHAIQCQRQQYPPPRTIKDFDQFQYNEYKCKHVLLLSL